MKALVIAPQPFFSPRGTPFSVYYRTLVLAELGVKIDLLTYGEGQDVDIPGVRILRIPRFRFLGPVKIGPSPLKLFLDMFIVLRTVVLLLTNRYDFVHAHEESVFFCRFLKPVFRFRLIYDMHSSLPQQLFNFDFPFARWLADPFDWLERSCLANADAVITICPDLAEYVSDLVPDPTRHFLIENSIFEEVRLRDSQNADATAATPSTELPRNRPVVLYAGTFESYQGLDLLVRAFADIRHQEPRPVLTLVGGSPAQVDRMKRLAKDCDLDGDCIFTGRVEPAVARRYVKEANVLVSPRVKGTNTPLKIYEQLASGIPLVATRIHSHTQVLTDDVCYLVAPKPESLGQGILRALREASRQDKLSDRARLLYEQKYSRRAYERKMRELLQRLDLCVESQA